MLRSWLIKAAEVAEESVALRRELGVRGDLAMSLNNASNHYSDLAGLERARDGRRPWLIKAVEAVEEAIAIRRKLGIPGDLASSLGSMCQHQRSLAGAEVEPAEVVRPYILPALK